MKTILENLKLYFQSTSRDQIEKDWAEFEKYNQVGPKVDDFISQSKYYHNLVNNKSYWEFTCDDNSIENPKFASDFFFILATLNLVS